MMLMPAAKEIACGQVSFAPQTETNLAGSNKIVFAHDYYECIIQIAEAVTNIPLFISNHAQQTRLADSQTSLTLFYDAAFFNNKPSGKSVLRTDYNEFNFDESVLTGGLRDDVFIVSSMLSYIGLLRLFDGIAPNTLYIEAT